MTNTSAINNGVTSTYNTTTQSTSTKNNSLMGGIDSDAYLTLFLASLKNQDPTSAMNTSEMMQQLSLLSQMQAVYDLQSTVEDMSDSLLGSQIQQSSALLGKEISAIKSDGTVVQGVAEDMYVNGDLITLLVEGKSVGIGEVSRVSLVKEKGGDNL